MFKEDSEGITDLETNKLIVSSLVSSVQMTEEECIEFTGSWNLMAAYTLLDMDGFELSVENLKKKMNVSGDEASVIIDTLESMGLLNRDESGSYQAKQVFIDSNMMPLSDLLNNAIKIKKQSIDRLKSKDIYGCQFDILSPEVINKYFVEFYGLLNKMKEESKGKSDCEVYAFDFSFAQASGNRKVK
jgi:hypothetical protein